MDVWYNSVLHSSSQTQLVTTSAVLAAVPLYFLARRVWQQRRSSQLPYPPGPPGHWLLGNALEIREHTKQGGIVEDKFLEWIQQYGDVITITVPVVGKLILIADPELIKVIAVKKNLPKGRINNLILALLGTESLVIIDNQAWAPKRKTFNIGFAPDFLKGMVPTMVQKLHRFLACIDSDIQANEPTNMQLRAQTFTADVIVAIAFGEDWGGDKPHPARLWLNEICNLTSGIIFDPMKNLFGFRTKWLVRKYERQIDDEMMQVLERRLAAGVSEDSKDICSLAIADMKRQNGTLTRHDKVSITHQLKTFYFAGHETTAGTIAWATWSFSKHPHVLEKVRAELREHGVWTDWNAPPTYEQLQKCVYLEAAIKETLRLYPPAGAVARRSLDANESYNGYNLGGAALLLSIYTVHRLPKLWKNPDEFRPERFLDGSEEHLNTKFMPFSRGPRDCIGKYFALLEAKLGLSALAMRYDFECVNPDESLKNLLTLIPRDGAKVKFTRRVM